MKQDKKFKPYIISISCDENGNLGSMGTSQEFHDIKVIQRINQFIQKELSKKQ